MSGSFKELCVRVDKINPSAASWMRKNKGKSWMTPCPELEKCFLWGESPQGRAFWENINDALYNCTDVDPEKLPPMSGPVTMEDGTVVTPQEDEHFELLPNGYARFIKDKPKPKRGSVLEEAINTINGERQDVYGAPEDSFKLIGEYWTIYLRNRKSPFNIVDAVDVAVMMTLFKIAREANQHKRDNIVDAAGYLGIYADMRGEG